MGTCGDITCDFCGQTHNFGNDATERYAGDSVAHTEFAGKTVCDCCFERVESAVLSRMSDILPWYRRHVERVKKSAEKADANLKALGA